jgi:hypothetical protein
MKPTVVAARAGSTPDAMRVPAAAPLKNPRRVKSTFCMSRLLGLTGSIGARAHLDHRTKAIRLTHKSAHAGFLKTSLRLEPFLGAMARV